MLKRFVVALCLSLFSLTSALVLAGDSDDNIKTKAVTLALNQADSKYSMVTPLDSNSTQLVNDINVVNAQNVVVKPKASANNEQSGWLLIFALFGFVMLSNRRGV